MLITISAWYRLGGDFYCTGTSVCTSSVTTSNQNCFTQTSQISADVGLEAAKLGVSFGVQYSYSWSNQTCNSETRTDACTWDDQACHAVWAQDVIIKQTGYKRMRCNISGELPVYMLRLTGGALMFRQARMAEKTSRIA